MGRATRWLRSLLGGKKETRNKDIQNENSSGTLKEKKRWSFGKVGRDTGDGSIQSPVEKAWSRLYLGEKEVERNKHAIAVAAATTAAADAAVAAAHAAAAVVKLTTQDRGTMFAAGGERCAAVKIQTFFRAYLAKKALRALKSLVKLQALVRGYLVRKQAAATLRSMQALIKAQATARAQRSRVLPVRDQTRFHHEIRPRRSLERNDESTIDHTGSFHSRRMSATFDQASGGFDDSPKTVEVDPGRPKSGNIRKLNLYLNPTPPDSTVDESHSSPLLQHPQFHSTNRLNSGWCLTGDECRFSTAQSTPRFLHSNGQPVTPAKSVSSGNRYNRRYTTNMSSDYSHHHNPNYMAKTESFLAKSRSQSAPKQRPEPRRRISLTEMVESRSSLSGVRMMKSCSGAQEAIDFKNTVVGRIDRSSELNRDGYYHYERDHYLQKRL